MRTLRPFAIFALASMCVLPTLTAEEKLDLPGPRPAPAPMPAPSYEPGGSTLAYSYPWESGIEDSLRRRLGGRAGEINFDGIAFDQLIDHLRDLSDINIMVNWSVLATAAIEKDCEVSLRLMPGTASFATVLGLILEEVGGGEVELGYTFRDGVVTISTKEDLARLTQVVFYNVSDLVRAAELRDRDGGALLRLISIIQQTVDPESWREAGGNVGAISDFSEILVVTQTVPAHELIWDMLQVLRSQMGLPVHGAMTPAVVR